MMATSPELIYRIVKYVISGSILFLLFRYVPMGQVSYTDIAMIVGIILITNILLDMLCAPKAIVKSVLRTYQPNKSKNECSCVPSFEHFDISDKKNNDDDSSS